MTARSLLLIAAFAVGCAPKMWVKPGATTDDFQDDQLKCEQFVYMRCAYASGLGLAVCRNSARDQCLTDRGWMVQK